jgi:4-hydroxy-tetrahydrodipicolinate reductase
MKILVSGAAGRMGREVLRAINEAEDMELVGGADPMADGEDAGILAGSNRWGVRVHSGVEEAILECHPDVMVDFSVPSCVMANIRTALHNGVSPVVGTTGLSVQDLQEVDRLAKDSGVGAFIAPNFAIGAVLMMEFAAKAAMYLPDAEIIEFHHEKKLDAPSGTAVLTAQKIAEARKQSPAPSPSGAFEKISGSRGGELDGVHIHSVRLSGYVAHQEVIFGGLGQTLVIRHDSIDRRSFMPGVILAIRKVRTLVGLTHGLEKLL